MVRGGPTRRQYVLAAAAGLGGMAGCSSLRDRLAERDTPTATDDPAPTETPTATATATDTPTGTTTGEPAVRPTSPDATTFPTPHATQANTGEVRHVSGPRSRPSEAWRFELDSHPYDPIVADGTVLVTKGGWRTGEKNFKALDLATGEVRWGVNLGTSGVMAPTVVGRHVLVPARDGKLLSIDWQAGETTWLTVVGNGEDIITPRVAAGVAVVGSRGYCYGLSPTDGSELWRYGVGRAVMGVPAIGSGGPLAGPTAFVPAIDDESVRKLHAIDVTTGERRWRISDEVVNNAGPAYRNGVVVYAGPDGTAARDASDGSLRWQLETGSETVPAVTENRVYLRTKSRLHALDLQSGDTQWSTDVSQLSFRRGVPGPTVTDGAIVVPEGSGANVAAYDPADGRQLWSIDFPYYPVRPISVVDGSLLVATHTDETEPVEIRALEW